MLANATRRLIKQRLADEIGRIEKDAPRRIALAYPSPYSVAMSSLGYQQIYRVIQAIPGMACERVFLADPGTPPEIPLSYEELRPLADFPVVALSVAYELEIAGVIELLRAGNIPPLREHRGSNHPFVIAGGPLTFSNPLPLAPFVDAIVMGEAEELVRPVLEAILGASTRSEALAALAGIAGVFVPEHDAAALPAVSACNDALLPAFSAIRTPHTELSRMFLIETERGCSRGCRYCVMRRSTNGGMRVVPKEVVLERIPRDAHRVGLVGAAVSDHPRIVDILHALGERGCEVGLSSLRPDRLKDELVEALQKVGYRTLTTALDGASERLRGLIERRGREPHYVAAAERARKYGMNRLKLYLMIGLPGETDADIDECAQFVGELSRVVPIALGIAPFCAKRNTPLDRMPYAGIAVVEQRLARLRRGLRGRADVRATSARWAWVEYVLAQGGVAEGHAVRRAVEAGARFADYRRAFAELGHFPDGAGYPDAEMPALGDRARRRLSVVSSA